MFDLLAGLALGYLIGSLPSAALIARLRGRRIFELGSGNMGAMNTARNLGFGLGLLVLGLDVGKGALAVFLARLLAEAGGASGTSALTLPLAAGVGAVLGHAWSAYVGFRGGKALATTLGVGLPLYPLAGFYGLLLLVALVLIVRRTGVASILTMVAYPFLVMAVLLNRGWPQEAVFAVVTSLLPISLAVIAKHVATGRSDRSRST